MKLRTKVATMDEVANKSTDKGSDGEHRVSLSPRVSLTGSSAEGGGRVHWLV